MRSSFASYWPKLLAYEGGFDNDPHDSGNWTGGKVGVGKLVGTKYGIDVASHPNVDIPNLTEDLAQQIYLSLYAPPIHFDELPAGLDVATLDPAINNGVSRASGWLQQVLGIQVDHKIGPQTVAAALAADDVASIKAICAQRLSFDEGLKSLWSRYGKGWAARITNIEVFAVGLAMAAAGTHPTDVATHMHTEAGKAATDAAGAKKAATTTGAGGTAGSAATASTSHGWVTAVIVVLALAGVALFAWQAFVHRQRASAYAAAAKDALTAKSGV